MGLDRTSKGIKIIMQNFKVNPSDVQVKPYHGMIDIISDIFTLQLFVHQIYGYTVKSRL